MAYARAMAAAPLDDLDKVRSLFLQMFVRAESMLQQAVRALEHRDPHLARAVIDSDGALDHLEMEVDRMCVRVLALQRPSGVELRFVTTVLKMVTDLERIGDLAGNIAERTLEIGVGPGLESGPELSEMGARVVEMVRMAADGFMRQDASVLQALQKADRTVDALNREGFQRWTAVMAQHPGQVERALAYTSICRYLERAADHTVNLGQMIVLLVEGRDVRHAS
jgi:phosphate transport system protein